MFTAFRILTNWIQALAERVHLCQRWVIQGGGWICVWLAQRFQRRQWHPTPVLLPGKSHGWRSLVGCNPWGHWGLDTTERLHFDFSLSCIGEGNGNPLQCSCLENPRDGGAWWAAVYGVTQSRTRLKWLSSSSSSKKVMIVSGGQQRYWAIYMHMYPFFHKLPSYPCCLITLSRVPCVIVGPCWPSILNTASSIPNFLTLSRLSPGHHNVRFLSLWVWFCFINNFIYILYFYMPHIKVVILYFSFLPYFTQNNIF